MKNVKRENKMNLAMTVILMTIASLILRNEISLQDILTATGLLLITTGIPYAYVRLTSGETSPVLN